MIVNPKEVIGLLRGGYRLLDRGTGYYLCPPKVRYSPREEQFVAETVITNLLNRPYLAQKSLGVSGFEIVIVEPK